MHRGIAEQMRAVYSWLETTPPDGGSCSTDGHLYHKESAKYLYKSIADSTASFLSYKLIF